VKLHENALHNAYLLNFWSLQHQAPTHLSETTPKSREH
jgi:hypothetical protein